MKSKPIFRLTVECEFDSQEERNQFRTILSNLDAGVGRFVAFKIGERFTACRLCGVPRSHGTLGNGLLGMSLDECRPAYAKGCQRRQENRKYLDERSETHVID